MDSTRSNSFQHLLVAVVAIVVGVSLVVALTLVTVGADSTTSVAATPDTPDTTEQTTDHTMAPLPAGGAGAIPAPHGGTDLGAAPPAAGPQFCVDGEYPPTPWGIVTSAPANDDHLRVPIHAQPDPASPVWSAAALGDTLALAPVTDFVGCAYLTDGTVFWAVWLDEGDWGWVDSFHVSPAAQPGWTDEPPSADPAPAEPPQSDMSGNDCWSEPGQLGSTCAEWDGDGTYTWAEFSDDETRLSAIEACVYGGDARACALLVAAGYVAEDAYGLGNSLTMAPVEQLRIDCTLGTSAWGSLSCAELATR